MIARATGEDRGPVRFPPPLIYIGALGLAVLLEAVVATPNLPFPLVIAVAVIATAASILLDFRAMSLFVKHGTGIAPWQKSTALVTDGPYRFTRNPMYLGMAILYAGFGLAFGLLWTLALLPVVIAIVDSAVIRREEAYLARIHGDAYRAYRERVRRWI